jgi:hypothetical protein
METAGFVKKEKLAKKKLSLGLNTKMRPDMKVLEKYPNTY